MADKSIHREVTRKSAYNTVKRRPTSRAGGQWRAVPSLRQIQRLWRVLLLAFSRQIPPLPVTLAVRYLLPAQPFISIITRKE